MKSFAIVLRKLRSREGLTLREAAGKIGISHVHLVNLENEHAIPSFELLDKLKKAYGVDPYIIAFFLEADIGEREDHEELADEWTGESEFKGTEYIDEGVDEDRL